LFTPKDLNYLSFQSFDFEVLMKVIQKRVVRIKTDISLFFENMFYCHWVDTSAGGILIPEGITHPVSQCLGHDMVYY
jgi:hypothetical protein